MKRLANGVILTVTLVAVFLYSGSTRTSDYSRLVATGDATLTNVDTFLSIEAFSGAIALRGDGMLAHLSRGETYHGRGDLEAAHSDLTKAHTLEPLATRRLEALGDVSRELGQHDAAVRLEAAAPGSPTLALLVRLANAHWHAGATARPRAVVADGLTRQPESSALVTLQRRFD